MRTKSYQSFYACCLIMLFKPAFAGISLDSTRIIYDGQSNKGTSISVTSSESSNSPFVIKTFIANTPIDEDTGNPPFFIYPSVFRLEPNSSQSVLIIHKNGELPQDRESVFYFRALAIPSGNKNNFINPSAVEGSLQVAGMTVIKLFYRPTTFSQSLSESMAKLRFISMGNKGVQVINDSPYYITLNNLRVNKVSLKINTSTSNSLIPPLGQLTFPDLPGQGKVEWSALNDFGGEEKFNGKVQ